MQKGLRYLQCTQRVRDYLARADLPAAIIFVDGISALNIDHECWVKLDYTKNGDLIH